MSEIDLLSNKLKDLQKSSVSKSNLREVEDLLLSKWEGVQSLAAQTLGIWGEHDSIPSLKKVLIHTLNKKNSSSAFIKVVLKAISECYKEEDVEWIMDLYFTNSLSQFQKHHFRNVLIRNMEISWAKNRIIDAANSNDTDKRIAAFQAVLFFEKPMLDLKSLSKVAKYDPDISIKKLASMIINKHHVA